MIFLNISPDKLGKRLIVRIALRNCTTQHYESGKPRKYFLFKNVVLIYVIVCCVRNTENCFDPMNY